MRKRFGAISLTGKAPPMQTALGEQIIAAMQEKSEKLHLLVILDDREYNNKKSQRKEVFYVLSGRALQIYK